MKKKEQTGQKKKYKHNHLRGKRVQENAILKPSLVLKDMINFNKGLMLNSIKGVVFSEKHLPTNPAIWENSRLWELSVFKEQQQRKLYAIVIQRGGQIISQARKNFKEARDSAIWFGALVVEGYKNKGLWNLPQRSKKTAKAK